MRKIIQIISSNLFVRFTVAFILNINSILGRIWSNLKFKSIVKNSGDSICHYSTELKYGERIKVGNNTRIGPCCTIGGKGGVSIGNNVVISKHVSIETAGLDYKKGPPYNSHKSSKIIIEDGVWIGTNVIVLAGVTIGENSIIGAGCVIAKDIKPNSLIIGQPFRVLK